MRKKMMNFKVIIQRSAHYFRLENYLDELELELEDEDEDDELHDNWLEKFSLFATICKFTWMNLNQNWRMMMRMRMMNFKIIGYRSSNYFRKLEKLPG